LFKNIKIFIKEHDTEIVAFCLGAGITAGIITYLLTREYTGVKMDGDVLEEVYPELYSSIKSASQGKHGL
jgi:hypothetical protein